MENLDKKSNILNISEFHRKFATKNKLSANPKATKLKYSSHLNGLPSEILLKIFNYLNIGELFDCSLVCKDWYKATNDISLWIKLSKLYKCTNEIDQMTRELAIDYKQALKRFICTKRELVLFKLGEKLNKKTNMYTGLPDLKSFQVDIANLDWRLKFSDKHSNTLFCLKSNEQNNFEAGFSVVWSNFSEVNPQMLVEVEKIQVLVNVPIYFDYKSGKVSSQKSKSCYYNINTEKFLVTDIENFFKELPSKNRKLVEQKLLHEDPIIKIFNMNNNFLIGYWTGSSRSSIPAFLSFNAVFDSKLIDAIFRQKSLISKKSKSAKGPSSSVNSDLELDSKFGLHDYKVYLCMRNQTKSNFLSLSQEVFVADLKKCKLTST